MPAAWEISQNKLPGVGGNEGNQPKPELGWKALIQAVFVPLCPHLPAYGEMDSRALISICELAKDLGLQHKPYSPYSKRLAKQPSWLFRNLSPQCSASTWDCAQQRLVEGRGR